MDLYSKIIEFYPDLEDKEFIRNSGSIELRDEGDGIQYIAKWEYDKPIPEGMKLGK